MAVAKPAHLHAEILQLEGSIANSPRTSRTHRSSRCVHGRRAPSRGGGRDLRDHGHARISETMVMHGHQELMMTYAELVVFSATAAG